MACEKYEELLQAFFDQSLPKDDLRQLKTHLDQCSKCRLDFIFYKNVFETLDELPDAEAPADISGEVLRAIEKEPIYTQSAVLRIVKPTVRRFRSASWALGLAAVLIMTIGLFSMGSDNRTPLPQPLLTAAIDNMVSNVEVRSNTAPAMVKSGIKLIIDGAELSLLRSGLQNWKSVQGDMELSVGDRIRTGENTKALLFYRDSGRMKLLPNTDLQILAQGIRIKRGTTWIKIFKRGTNFYAETPNAVASVRGTVYTVEYDPEALATRVNLFSTHNPAGGVMVETETGSALLQEGTFVDVVMDELTEANTISLDTYLAFNQLPPDDVVLSQPIVDTEPAAADTSDDTDSQATVDDSPDSDDVNVRSESVKRPVPEDLNKGDFFNGMKNR